MSNLGLGGKIMAAAEYVQARSEYVIRYFEHGEMQWMTIVADSKKQAYQQYLELGKKSCDLFMIWPDQ
ncbi:MULTISPECIES: RNA helicase [unclassified Vibrio]|uniref:RNA helicase n=1 Tax=Vibrio sp. HB236076 TaxID=3232307 RepID=A0AB39HFU6_9VIBR|nr:RNA helicase [Vibrio sp. HB161653]MDP5253216.1 RNA helicase [Vibrio sp. HB161653]